MFIAKTPSPADMARYEGAVGAAANPDSVMDGVTARFRDMGRLAAAGERLALLGAANGDAEACLRLSVVPTTSSTAADSKVRFLAIMAGWAWLRRPALAAILDVARRPHAAHGAGTSPAQVEPPSEATRHAAADGDGLENRPASTPGSDDAVPAESASERTAQAIRGDPGPGQPQQGQQARKPT